MKKLLILLMLYIIFGLTTVDCSFEKNPLSNTQVLADNLKVAVYHTVLDSLVLLPRVQRIVFKDSTELFPHIREEIYSQISDLDPFTLTDFQQINQNALPFYRIPDISVEQILISNQEFQNILIQGGWELFYNRYPESTGLIGMSAIGINSEGNQALVYFSQCWYDLAGAGKLVFLTKSGDWQIAKVITVWIS
jgi:hypothetical protein